MPAGSASSGEASAAGSPLENPAFLTAPQAIFPGLRARDPLALGERGVLLTRSADIATLLTNPEATCSTSSPPSPCCQLKSCSSTSTCSFTT